MHNKMIANEKIMLTEILRKVYMQSWVSSNALTQLEPRIRKSNSWSFATAHEILDILTSVFGDPNRKQTVHTKYQTFRQRDWEFNNFWVKFQRLAIELDHSKETLIDDFIEKCYYTIQQQLATGEKNPTSLTQLAKRCQRIELSLKKVGQNKLTHERYTAWKTGFTATKFTSAAPATISTTSAAPASSRFLQILQPRLPSTTTNMTTPSITSTPGLTEDERTKLIKFSRCFKCKQESHMLLDCTQLFRPYSAINALLQEVTLVEDVASASENK